MGILPYRFPEHLTLVVAHVYAMDMGTGIFTQHVILHLRINGMRTEESHQDKNSQTAISFAYSHDKKIAIWLQSYKLLGKERKKVEILKKICTFAIPIHGYHVQKQRTSTPTYEKDFYSSPLSHRPHCLQL